MSYIQANPPKQYIVRQILYLCDSCDTSFSTLVPQGNDLVKYISQDGKEERWLPTYGEGGYLSLMKKLILDFDHNQEISMEISRRFESAFSAIQKRPATTGMPFVLFVRANCPKCHSENLKVVKESLLDTPPLLWMEYKLQNC